MNSLHGHHTKRFINVAVQATKKKSTHSTQTKFGRIDHCFLPQSPSLMDNQLLRLSENLTKAIVDCKSNNFHTNDDDDSDQNLKQLLSSLDDDDDDVEYGSNLIKSNETLSKFDDDHHTESNQTIGKNPVESLWYSKSKRLMKKQKVQDCIFILLDDIRKKKTLDQLLPNSGQF